MFYWASTFKFAQLKKIISILFVFVFLLQALPVMQWMYGNENSSSAIEMTDGNDGDGSEKNFKDKILISHLQYKPNFAFKSFGLNPRSTENAIILHHADISTPPPDITG